MNSSNRVWILAAVPCCCFVLGVYFAPRGPGARAAAITTASATATETPDIYTAPHKPTVEESRLTPTPGPAELPDLPESSPNAVAGGVNYWVCQDNSPLYQGLGLNQPVIQRLPCSTALTLLREQDDWMEVQVVGGGSGWMKMSQVTDHPPPGGAGPRPQDAKLSLDAYFDNLNKRDYRKAYDHLSFEFKRDLPFRTFSEGYSGLNQVYWRVIRIQTLSPQSQIFYVEMLCEERPKNKAYQGEYTMVLEHDHWYIAQGDLKEINPKSLAPFPTQTVPNKPAFEDPTPDPDQEEDSFE